MKPTARKRRCKRPAQSQGDSKAAGAEDIIMQYAKFENETEKKRMCKNLHSRAWHKERDRCIANGHDDTYAKAEACKVAAAAVERWQAYVD